MIFSVVSFSFLNFYLSTILFLFALIVFKTFFPFFYRPLTMLFWIIIDHLKTQQFARQYFVICQIENDNKNANFSKIFNRFKPLLRNTWFLSYVYLSYSASIFYIAQHLQTSLQTFN